MLLSRSKSSGLQRRVLASRDWRCSSHHDTTGEAEVCWAVICYLCEVRLGNSRLQPNKNRDRLLSSCDNDAQLQRAIKRQHDCETIADLMQETGNSSVQEARQPMADGSTSFPAIWLQHMTAFMTSFLRSGGNGIGLAGIKALQPKA